MPYIKPEKRKEIETGKKQRQELTGPGELNYMITMLLIGYVSQDPNGGYQAINDCLGALEGAKLEFYRRLAVPYENKKKKENGDVYPKACKCKKVAEDNAPQLGGDDLKVKLDDPVPGLIPLDFSGAKTLSHDADSFLDAYGDVRVRKPVVDLTLDHVIKVTRDMGARVTPGQRFRIHYQGRFVSLVPAFDMDDRQKLYELTHRLFNTNYSPVEVRSWKSGEWTIHIRKTAPGAYAKRDNKD